MVTTKGDYIPGGTFWARQDAWNASNLVSGKDYIQNIIYFPDVFPNKTTIEWNWQKAAANGSPWGYPGLAWGNQQPGVSSPAAKQLRDFSALSTEIHYLFSADPRQMDILHEMWLYPGASAGDSGPSYEVGILLVPKTEGRPQQYYIFSITEPFLADVYFIPISWRPAFMIYPKTPMIGAVTVDWLSIYKQLIAYGRLTGDEYAYGFEFGAEPWIGIGSMTVASFNVIWK